MQDIRSSFHGVATIGEKGQVVIPASARRALHLEPGEKLLVFDMGGGSLMLSKASEMARLAGPLAERLQTARRAMEIAGGRLERGAKAKEREPGSEKKTTGRKHERRTDPDA